MSGNDWGRKNKRFKKTKILFKKIIRPASSKVIQDGRLFFWDACFEIRLRALESPGGPRGPLDSSRPDPIKKDYL